MSASKSKSEKKIVEEKQEPEVKKPASDSENKEPKPKKEPKVFDPTQYVVNPKTKRHVKIGSRLYLKLVKDGDLKE